MIADALGIGARHITVSTVGVLPGIVALGERPEQFRLAISIHAPTDSLRRELMPINTKYPLADVIDAAKVFDRRVTFEYVMLGGVNDGDEHAIQLARLARECRAFVNLIPLHPGGAQGLRRAPRNRIPTFARELRARGVEVAVRKSRGIDIAAACGQLRVERLRPAAATSRQARRRYPGSVSCRGAFRRAPTPSASRTRCAHSGCPDRSSTTVVSRWLLTVPISTTSKPRSRSSSVARRASPRVFVELSTCTRMRTPSGARLSRRWPRTLPACCGAAARRPRPRRARTTREQRDDDDSRMLHRSAFQSETVSERANGLRAATTRAARARPE